MAELKVIERNGGLAFYIDGSLQFDTRDEGIYHESLALPAAALAAARFRRPLSALILGGGDGLALRELLKFKEVAAADLVDYDSAVLELGRNEFSAYNRAALSDPRVKVSCTDAVSFLKDSQRTYDIVLADFTFPCDLAGCSLFTREFFFRVSRVLSRRGIFALNAVSPDNFSPAYWGIYKTMRAAGLYPKPLAAAIPSFSAHGYGRWGFFFSSPRAITPMELGALRISVPAGFVTPAKLHENMCFCRSDAMFGTGIASCVQKPADLLALLNMPGPAAGGSEFIDFFSRSNRALPCSGFPGDPALWSAETLAVWEDRLAGIAATFDWERLLAEAGRISGRAAEKMREELDEFKAELPSLMSGSGSRAQRVYRILAVLSILLILVNMAYPDNAFAKGYSSRGHSGGSSAAFFSDKAAAPFHGLAFQFPGMYNGLVPDSSGKMYPKKTFTIKDSSAALRAGTVKAEQALYALTDTLRVTAQGTVFLLQPDLPYAYRVEGGSFTLFKDNTPEPLFTFRPDAEIVNSFLNNIQLQQKALKKALSDNRKWLAWAGPAGVVLPPIKAESQEALSMLAIQAALDKAAGRVWVNHMPDRLPDRLVKLAPGVYVSYDTGSVILLRDDGYLVNCRLPGLPVFEDAEQLQPGEELAAFVRALLVNKVNVLPPGNPARQLFNIPKPSPLEMPINEYQKLNAERQASLGNAGKNLP